MTRKSKPTRRGLTPISYAIAISRHRPRRTLEHYIAAFRADGGRTEGDDKRRSPKKGSKT